MADRRTPRGALHLAYLVSRYPAVSHTFISREVRALREAGLVVDTFSVRPTFREELQDHGLREEYGSTFTILRQPLVNILAANAIEFAHNPLRYVQTLVRALRHRVPGIRAFALSFAYLAEAGCLAHEMRRRGVTHLHNHFANSGATVGYLAADLLRLPWSLTLHGISETDYPAGLMLARKIGAANFVACVSYFGRSQAMRVVDPAQWPKFRIIRCGLSKQNLPAHEERGEVRRVICVGRLSAEKGQAGLLDAFSRVLQDHPDLELLLIGDGPERERLQSVAGSMRISDRVNFGGRCGERETLAHIAQADILVLPSFMEGLPVVLMEAMAIGTPVIASRVAGIPELVEDGKSGLLFTPSDWKALADCISRLVDDPRLRNKLARGGRAAVGTEFDSERSARMMRKLFEAEGTELRG